MPSHKSKARYKNGKRSGWSDWCWESNYNCWYRYNFSSAEYEYRHIEPANHEISTSQQETLSTHRVSSGYQSGMESSEGMKKIVAGNLGSPNYEAGMEPRKHEKLDEGYRVHDKKEFQFGRVFKVLWSEPGSEQQGQSSRTSNIAGDSYQKVRRFVIVAQDKGHCVCLPIITYTSQGATKTRIKTMCMVDEPLPTSLDLGPEDQPNKLFRCSSSQLDSSSRINYAKLYTVEYNVKVWFIGKVSQSLETRVLVGKTNPDVEKGHHHIYHDQCSIPNRNPNYTPPLSFHPGERSKSILALNFAFAVATGTSFLWLNARMSLVHESFIMHSITSTLSRTTIPTAIKIPAHSLPIVFIFAIFTFATAIFTGTTFFLTLSQTKLHKYLNLKGDRDGKGSHIYSLATTTLCVFLCAIFGFTAEELILVCLPLCISIGTIAGSIFKMKAQDESKEEKGGNTYSLQRV
ncbi:hypothetical protein B0J14DRAFT_356399 [Halenospora varia]|nr:hypothetical protein B0J14DRAFT_356399 [Halenospora varia]